MGKNVIWLAVALLIATGCATRGKPIPTDIAQQNRKMVVEFKNLDLDVKETPRGVAIYFPEVLLFDYDKDRLKSGARAKMHQIAVVVTAPQYNFRDIAVEGHADAMGPQKYNLGLSQRRAESVARELVFSGVAKERMVITSFGESQPVAPNRNPDGSDNPEGRALNRRVEIFILN